jgi:hypothetical protein
MENVSKPCALPPIGSQAPVFALAFVLAVSAGCGLAVAQTVTEKSTAATLPQGNAPIIDVAIVTVSLVIILINFVIDLEYGMFGPRNMLGASVTFQPPEADRRAHSKSTVEGATPSSDGLRHRTARPELTCQTMGRYLWHGVTSKEFRAKSVARPSIPAPNSGTGSSTRRSSRQHRSIHRRQKRINWRIPNRQSRSLRRRVIRRQHRTTRHRHPIRKRRPR